MASEIKNGKLYVDGQQCCYRCGMAKQSAEIREGWKCSGWGITHRTHLWTIHNETTQRRVTGKGKVRAVR
jgi:hypothetical protein